MSIVVQCDCGKQLSVRDAHAGKRVKCPECGSPVAVPEADVVEPFIPIVTEDRPKASSSVPTTRPGVVRVILAVSVALAVGFAAGRMSVPGIAPPEHPGKEVVPAKEVALAKVQPLQVAPPPPKFDPRRWELKSTLALMKDSPQSVAFSPNGKLIAAGAAKDWATPRTTGEAKVWETSSLSTLGTYRTTFGIRHVTFSREGTMLATSGLGLSRGATTLWDVTSGRERLTFDDSRGESASFSPDGRSIVVACSIHPKLFDINTGQVLKVFNASGSSLVTFSPDGSQLLCGRTLWDVVLNKEIIRLSNGSRGSYSPDGERIVLGGPVPLAPGPTKIFSARTGEEVLQLDAPGSSSVGFSPDGSAVATGHLDGYIRVWKSEDGRPLATLPGNSHGVTALAFSPDGGMIVAGYSGGAVKLWEAGRR